MFLKLLFFSPSKITDLKPSAAKVDFLLAFPFLSSTQDLLDLKGELATYLASAEGVDPFTSFIRSSNEVLHQEYAAYQYRLGSQLVHKWDKLYATAMSWGHIQTQFAIFQAVNLHHHGSCRRLMGLSIFDRAGIGIGH